MSRKARSVWAYPPLTPTEIATARNPAFTAEDVTDFGAVDFVADLFMLPGPDRWHLFFEVCNYARDPDAVIGHATSPDGLRWEYDRAVLNTGEHLSFPYVFEWEGTRYMVPEEGGSAGRSVRLYEATDFPREWEPCATLVSADHRTDDTVLFRWRDRWWLLVGDGDDEKRVESGVAARVSSRHRVRRRSWPITPRRCITIRSPCASAR